MAHSPWLSVIVPTFNGQRYLRAALDSIAAERANDLEVIAIDDGSTDNTLAILKEFETTLPITLIEQTRAGNWVRNTNIALHRARGLYACFLHQDDFWYPGRLRTVREGVKQFPEALMATSSARFVDSGGRDLGPWSCPLSEGVHAKASAARVLLIQNFLAIGAPVFCTQAGIAVGGLDESLWYAADWDFWLKLAKAGAVAICPGHSVAFRVHAEAQTATRTQDSAAVRKQLESVLARHAPALLASVPDHKVSRAARLSVEVNVALASLSHRQRVDWNSVARQCVVAGLGSAAHYLQYSRIVERVRARVRCL